MTLIHWLGWLLIELGEWLDNEHLTPILYRIGGRLENA